METVVEIEGVNGEWFTIAGPNEGAEGIHLGTGVKGFYDPPVKVVYEEPGNYPGARYLGRRILRRDITFGVEILNDRNKGNSWMSRDSEWRKAWAFERDTKIHLTTDDYGHRALKCRLGESPDISLFEDPDKNTINRADMIVIAGDPFWWEDDQVFSVKTKTDTRFDPSFWTPPWPWEQLPKEELHIKVSVANPTDQYIFPIWSIPGAEATPPNMPWPFPPNTPIPWEAAPFAQYTLPDYSFEDPDQRNRAIKTPGLIKGEDCIVNTDPREETYSSASGTNVWARTNGVRFRNAIPPYTGSVDFKIEASGVARGQTIELRLQRPWSRPWGLE